jgi:hypothetical protein
VRPETLGLRYEARGSLVRVGWDKSLASIAAARSGVLSIREGGRETTVPLAGDQLRTGSVVYTRMGGGESVRFRLEVTDAQSHRTSEDLTAQLPPENVAARGWRRGTPDRHAEAGFVEDPPTVPSGNPKPFQAPARRQIESAAHAELPDLPAVSLPGATGVSLPTPMATVLPPPPKAVVYTPPKPVRVARPALPSSVAAMVRSKTRIQVKVGIDRNGHVVSAEAVAADRKSQLLGGIVETAARDWRFEPARRDGVAVADDLVVNVDFEAGGK